MATPMRPVWWPVLEAFADLTPGADEARLMSTSLNLGMDATSRVADEPTPIRRTWALQQALLSTPSTGCLPAVFTARHASAALRRNG